MIKDEGFVLRKINYSSSSVIIKVFTRENGLQSFMVRGVRKAKSKIKQNHFQPFTLLDISYREQNKSIKFLTDLSVKKVYESIPYHYLKIAQAQFLAEFLNKVLIEDDPDITLFKNIKELMHDFDKDQNHFSNFHLYALWKWIYFFGIAPEITSKPCLNMLKSQFEEHSSNNQYLINEHHSNEIKKLIKSDYSRLKEFKLNRAGRREILHCAVLYYQLNFDDLKDLKSMPVLQQVMDAYE